jgi:hypothetical protein
MQPEPELLNQKAVCHWLGITRDTMWKWRCKQISLPCFQIGNRTYYSRQLMMEWFRDLTAAQRAQMSSALPVISQIPVPLGTTALAQHP